MSNKLTGRYRIVNKRFDPVRPLRGRSFIEWIGSIGAGFVAAGATIERLSGPWYVVLLIGLGTFLATMAGIRLAKDRGRPFIPPGAVLVCLSLLFLSCSLLPRSVPGPTLGGTTGQVVHSDRCVDLDNAYIGLTVGATVADGLSVGAHATALAVPDNEDAVMGLNIVGGVMAITAGGLTLGANEVGRRLVEECGRVP